MSLDNNAWLTIILSGILVTLTPKYYLCDVRRNYTRDPVMGTFMGTWMDIIKSPNASLLNSVFANTIISQKFLSYTTLTKKIIAIKYNLKKSNFSNKAFSFFLWQTTIIINLICGINIICEVPSGSNLHNLKISLLQYANVPSRLLQLQYWEPRPRTTSQI